MIASAPAILLEAHLDAVRDLGRHGVRVIACSSEPNHPVRSSRYVSAFVHSPRIWDPQFGAWFERLLDENPGAVVFPNAESDSFWLAEWRAAHPDSSARIAVPTFEALRSVTLKQELYEACIASSLAAPKTWPAPTVEAAIDGLGTAKFPLVVKPQTRCGNLHWGQGQLVRDKAALEEALEWSLRNVRFRDEVTSAWPSAATPLVQEFIGGRDRPIYHISGFLNDLGEWAALGHRKLLQFPRRFGSGICMESAPLDEELAAQLMAMLRSLGFSGMFEAEFIERGDERLLIDLNPRSYNGMCLDLARGLAPAWWSYLQATNASEQLSSEMRRFRESSHPSEHFAFCRRLEFAAMLVGQTASGGFNPKESLNWAKWYWRNRKRMIDPFSASDDRKVGRARLVRQLDRWRKKPRQFLGTYVRGESGR